MDFSKLKIEVYDLLGLILPGLGLICEGWILFSGWHVFLNGISQITGTSLTLLLVAAFAAGNAVQEFADLAVKRVKGNRFLRAGRDRFWVTPEAELVRNKIHHELGYHLASVDTAFDYSLTKLEHRFAKRDIFVAISDLCRSLVVLALLALAPAFRTVFYEFHKSWLALVIAAAVALAVSFLLWRRMVRFRELTEVTVFRIYLALEIDSEVMT